MAANIFRSGKLLEIGLMFASAIYHALVSLLKHQHMATVMVYWHIISKMDNMVNYHLMD
jgi:hypothetical protein